ncbi:DUF721 domain-containing protein [Dethiobacter alkaliphilus]|uniref:Zn-ribbon-containing protein n=1 Tax=Dethiobacter alkaliphilus AHT 1 TaxID=555088 RepID=C0GI70_DETAL|nr:DUF721 domain-containing protein [Dethiobacter alkaliphilus]EEG76918.1 hypothetical protein DealDRAFT_2179 [Dethiobacter alkaliphilus AHT 1]
MKTIATVLDQALKRLPNAKKIKGQMMIDAWPHVVGGQIAKKTMAVSFENGILFVWVNDSVWAQHLALQKKQIIAQLNRYAKTRALTDLRFQAGGKRPSLSGENQPEEAVENWRLNKLDEETLSRINQAFSETELPADLEDTMKSFFTAQQQRIRWYLKQGYTPCVKCGMPQIVVRPEKTCFCCKNEDKG